MKKQIWKAAVCLVCSGVILAGLQRLLVPKYMGTVVEGNFTQEYYRETSKHDVLFLGNCEVYENISPVTLWQEYGITSYIRGNAQQLIAQSYYLLEDTLRREKPEAVVLGILSMKQFEQDRESYNRMTLDGMRWSDLKWKAIRSTMMEDEHMVEYVFPLLRFHSRWKELKKEDLAFFWNRDPVSHNGYYMRADVRPAGDFPAERRLADYSFDQRAWEYLNRIRDLCREQGILLILMKAPTLYPAWYDQWEEQIRDYAKENRLLYLNGIEKMDEIGIDFSRDTYDGGLHMNVYGAEKMARYFGGVLKECGIKDRRGDPALSAIWQEKCARYEACKAQQEKDFAELGYLPQFHEE